MGNVIATNVPSLNAQRNLLNTGNALGTSLQRLSSGLRINSAKDDAAGLQISNRLTAQIGGLTVAARNANDGISLSQVAEGALQESTNILQRIRDLSIQSANGTNGASERAALQQEVAQLKSELQRIGETTRFGSRLLLDGTFGSQSFQVGAQAFETITVTTADVRAQSVGSYQINTTAANKGAEVKITKATTNSLSGDSLAISGYLGQASVTYGASASASEIAAAVNAVSDQTGVEAKSRTNVKLDGLSAAGTVSFEITSDNSTPVAISASVSNKSDLTSIAEAINKETAKTGVSATVSPDRASVLLTNEKGEDITLDKMTHSNIAATIDVALVDFDGGFAATDELESATGAGVVLNGAGVANAVGVLQYNSSRSYTITPTTANELFLTNTAQGAGLVAVADIDISTAIGAQNALAVVDQALQAIDSVRGDLGAVQNRFQSTITNLNNISENVSAARSRIRDTDFAAETANLSKGQVLQQAGLAILSQANALPQSVLQLLQG